MALPAPSHGLEAYYVLNVLKLSSQKEVCNCSSRSEVDASVTDNTVSSVTRSDSEDTDVKEGEQLKSNGLWVG
jgi:hypothetical protein